MKKYFIVGFLLCPLMAASQIKAVWKPIGPFTIHKTIGSVEAPGLGGYGSYKYGCELLPEKLISRIKYLALFNNLPQNNIHWELAISIPKELFYFNKLTTLTGKKCRVHFYKCNDNLPTPHFVGWSGIYAAEPNFHLPAYFGALDSF